MTFEEAGRFFNITFTRTPEDCTESVTFSSSDEAVATVSEQGKIVGCKTQAPPSLPPSAASRTAQCLVTCDFAYVGAETSEEEPAELALNKDDLTFLNPGRAVYPLRDRRTRGRTDRMAEQR